LNGTEVYGFNPAWRPADGEDAAQVTSTRQPTIAVGDMVGRYRILGCLGVGAMGEVFLALDDSLGRQAAVKLLAGHLLGDLTVRRRFLSEARALARLSHPNLITVYEAGTVGPDERPYFAMELLAGGDTEELLSKGGPLASGVAAVVAVQAAAGLGEAARAGIVHRDVKPANLGISAQGVLKVTDFGVAKSLAAGRNLTRDGLTVGTADYISPEQARGEPVDERADVYSLGCSLFHLVTGRPPYREGGASQPAARIDTISGHLFAPVPDPRAEVSWVDDELAELILTCMQKRREQRPTFGELLPRLVRLNRRLGGELPRLGREQFGPVT
jgi:serine/threonine protein kinase